MELLLNAIWLMVSAFPIAWWARKHSFASGRREFCLAIAAMLCVGILLFSPISISDDLHQDLFAAEDANSSKKMVAGSVHANVSFSGVAAALGVIAATVGMFQLSLSYLIPSFTQSSVSSVLVRLIPSRAPPSA